jgi:hypothetical protein
MKRVVLFFALVLGLISVNAQTWNKVAGNWEYKYLRIDGTQGTFTPPLDTLPGAAVGSIAIKNDVLYKKGSSAWGPVVGSGGGGDPSLNYKRIGFGGVGGKLSPGEAEFYYDSVTNQLGVDTVLSKKVWADSVNARKKIIINPTGESYAQIDGAQELGPGLFIRQQITNDGRDVNEHGVIDRTEICKGWISQ